MGISLTLIVKSDTILLIAKRQGEIPPVPPLKNHLSSSRRRLKNVGEDARMEASPWLGRKNLNQLCKSST